MKTHRIKIVSESQTLFKEARRLLAEGIAEPGDRIETWRGNTLCLSGPVWAAAKLTVDEEGSNGAPRFKLWKPFAAGTSAPGMALQENPLSDGTPENNE